MWVRTASLALARCLFIVNSKLPTDYSEEDVVAYKEAQIALNANPKRVDRWFSHEKNLRQNNDKLPGQCRLVGHSK